MLLCDPPRQRAEGGNQWCDIDTLARECDIITFHTPLTRTGEDATFHMVDAAFLSKLRRAPILINTARGEIFDTKAWELSGRLTVCISAPNTYWATAAALQPGELTTVMPRLWQ